MSPTDRYSNAAFPAYRYVPGRAPHPLRDPRGHAFGAPEPDDALEPDRWSSCETYLHAIDLFNHAYYWEAHEALESLWRRAGRRTETGVFLQGLIQLAAALLKHEMGSAVPARHLAERGGAKLRSLPGTRFGIDGNELAAAVLAHVGGAHPHAEHHHGQPAPRVQLDIEPPD